MNSFQVMRFVDKATPQQLQQMVAARDPYSYMALSKLQEIRDNKLKADAKQPEAPPLTQTIPQQIAQLDQPQGIAALPQAMPQGQQAPQDMPQEMQQASGIGPAMAPTGAGGGLVSFKHGGIAHFVTGDPVVGRNPGEVSESTVGAWWRSLPANQSEAYAQSPAGIADSASFADLTKKKNAILETLTPFTAMTKTERAQREAALVGVNEQIDSIRTRRQNLGASAPAVTPTPVTPPFTQALTVPPGAPADTPISGLKEPTDADVSNTRRPAGNPPDQANAQSGAGNFGLPFKNLQMQLDAAAKSKADFFKPGGEGSKLAENVGKAAYSQDEYSKLIGTPEEQKQALKDTLTNIKDLLPDHMAPVLDSIKKYHAEASAEEGKAPYQGMLKMATALMSTKSPNFLQALGEAGGAGLEEYNKINELNKTRKMKLLEVDANMGAAQNARDRGNLQLAQSHVDKAQSAKVDEYHAKTNAKVATAQLQFQLAGTAANVPIEMLKHQTDLLGAEAHLITAKAAVINAGKPGAEIQLQNWLHDSKHPERIGWMQSSQDAEAATKLTLEAGKEYARLEALSQIPAGITQNAWINQLVDTGMANRTAYRKKSEAESNPSQLRTRPDSVQ